MCSSKKHMQRSHRSYREPKPFATFHTHAKRVQEVKTKKSVIQKLKDKFNRKVPKQKIKKNEED